MVFLELLYHHTRVWPTYHQHRRRSITPPRPRPRSIGSSHRRKHVQEPLTHSDPTTWGEGSLRQHDRPPDGRGRRSYARWSAVLRVPSGLAVWPLPEPADIGRIPPSVHPRAPTPTQLQAHPGTPRRDAQGWAGRREGWCWL